MNSDAASKLVAGVRRCFLVQVLSIVLVAGLIWLLWGGKAMLASLFGGGIALLNTWLLARRVARAVDSGRLIAHGQLGMLERLAVTAALMALGMGALKLVPAALIAGFAVPYIGYVFADRSSGWSISGPSAE